MLIVSPCFSIMDVQLVKIYTSTFIMSTKLTLRLDETLIAAAKTYARAHGRSVSVLVADYFANLTQPPRTGDATGLAAAPTSKITASLRGALQGSQGNDLDEADYKRHLESRYQ